MPVGVMEILPVSIATRRRYAFAVPRALCVWNENRVAVPRALHV